MKTMDKEIIDYVSKYGPCTVDSIANHFRTPIGLHDIIENSIWLLCDLGKLKPVDTNKHCRMYEIVPD